MRVLDEKVPSTISQLALLHLPDGRVQIPTGNVYRMNPYREGEITMGEYLSKKVGEGARVEMRDNLCIRASLRPMGDKYRNKHYQGFQDRDDPEQIFYLNGQAVREVLDAVINQRVKVEAGWIISDWRFQNIGGTISLYIKEPPTHQISLVASEDALVEEDVQEALGFK